MPAQKTYSLGDTARLLNCTPRHVRRLIDTAELDAERTGEGPQTRWRISYNAVRRFRGRRERAGKTWNGNTVHPPKRKRRSREETKGLVRDAYAAGLVTEEVAKKLGISAEHVLRLRGERS